MQGPPPPPWGPTAVQYPPAPPGTYLPVRPQPWQLPPGAPCSFVPMQPPGFQLQQQGVHTSWLIYGPGPGVPLLPPQPGEVVAMYPQQHPPPPPPPPLPPQHQQQPGGDPPAIMLQPEGQHLGPPPYPPLARMQDHQQQRRAGEQELQQQETSGQRNAAHPASAPADDQQQQQLQQPAGGLRLRIIMPQRLQQRQQQQQDGQQGPGQQDPQEAHTPAGAPVPPALQQQQQQSQPPGSQQPPPAPLPQQQRQLFPTRTQPRRPKPSQPQQQLQQPPPRWQGAAAFAAAAALAAGPASEAGRAPRRPLPQPPLTRAQRKEAKRQRDKEAEAAGAFRQPPGLRLRAGAAAQDHPEFDFLFGGQQHQQQQQHGGYQNQQQQQQQHLQQRPAGAGGVLATSSPAQFFRERADDSNPFWMSAVGEDAVGVLGTVPLQAPRGCRPGSFSMANCELVVVLSPQQLLQVQGGACVQLWCFKLGDPVPCRVHWPYTNQQLLVNEAVVRPVMAKRLKPARPDLGPHQGDLPVDVTNHVLQSAAVPANRLACMARLTVRLTAQVLLPATAAAAAGSGFVLGCRLVRPRNIEEVKALLPPAPPLPQAVKELQDKLSGDEDIVAEATSVSIRCSTALIPMVTPANFGTGEGLVCFDLDSFLAMTQQSGKWQCPGTRNFHSWKQLRTSPWLAAVLRSLEEAGLKQTVADIEVAPDAKWRPTGAPKDCWFDVLHPPTAQQLKDCLRPGAAAAAAAGDGAGGVLADSDDDKPAGGNGLGGRATTKRAQQQPQKEVCDLTLTDSEDEQQQQEQQRRPAPAAGAAGAAAASKLAAHALRWGPKPLPAAAAAAAAGAGGGRGAAALPAAGSNRQPPGLQLQGSGGVAGQQAPHRHGYQHKVSLHDWRRQQELVRHAQEQQQQRLVRQGSGAVPQSFLAMMQDSTDSTPPPAPPPPPPAQLPPQQQQQGEEGGLRQLPNRGRPFAAAAAAAALAADMAAGAAADGDQAEWGSGDEAYDPLADYDGDVPGRGLARGGGEEDGEQQGLTRGGGEEDGEQQGREGRQRSAPPPSSTTQDEDGDSWDDEVWDDFDELRRLEDDAWRVRLQALQRSQAAGQSRQGASQQQQQQQRPRAAAGRAAPAAAAAAAAGARGVPPGLRVQAEPEVIDLISDSE